MTEIGALLGMSPQALNQVFRAKDVKSGIIEDLSECLGIPIPYLYEEQLRLARGILPTASELKDWAARLEEHNEHLH